MRLTIDEILAAFAAAVAEGDLESAESWFAAAATAAGTHRGPRSCGRPPGSPSPVRAQHSCQVSGPVRTIRRR